MLSYIKYILVTLGMLLALVGHAQTNNNPYGVPIQLNWSSFNTNNIYLRWSPNTNACSVLRYTAYWTPFTNVDTGTNWTQTTNWNQFADCSSSQTDAPMSMIPTNVWITWITTFSDGNSTVPAGPIGYTNQGNITLTNQPGCL
jgi:hypothetical protein